MNVGLFASNRSVLVALAFLVLPAGLSAQESIAPSPVPTPLTLEMATEILLARNPAILRERQNVVIARSGVQQARLLPNPAFDLTSESYPLFEPNPGPFFQRNEIIARVGQPIETAGKRRKRTAVAEQDVLVVQSLLQDTIRQLKLEVKTRYYLVVLAKAELELAQEILKQFDEIIRLNQARYQQGEVSGLDLARVEAERLRFFNDVVAAELELQNAKAALLELLGVSNMATAFDVSGELGFRPLAPDRQSLEQQAIAGRTDLLARREVVERENRQVRLEKARAVPDVTPFLGYKRNLTENTITFGFNIGLPFFNRNQGGIGQATARTEQARQEQYQTELAVRREVFQAYQRVLAEERRIRAMQDTFLERVRRARDIAQASYRLGALDLIAFLDAERTYRETLRGYNRTLFDHHTAVFQLEAAVGKDF
jgi:cobalt-zinc-cadmium efflux system outer membrane protein